VAYESKKYKSKKSFSRCKKIGNMNFVHQYFPVIYDTIKGYKEILIDPKSFKWYDIAFPDSLKWVLKYF